MRDERERARPDDGALVEALAACAASGRLSDAQVRAMRGNRRRVAASAGVAVSLFAVGAGVWHISPAAKVAQIAHIETRRGELRVVRLRDGSMVRINGATVLDVRLESDGRHAVLTRGEAYFDIAHDVARPFEVVANRSSTRVLGTAFDIDLAGGGVKIAVYRGRVRFGSSTTGHDGVIVPAGWRSQFRGGVAAMPSRFDSGQQDWRKGWLDTDAMRLKDVVETLNRGDGPLIEAPPAVLANLPLSGRFKLDEPRQLLEAIGAAYGFTVQQRGDTLRLEPR